MRISISMTKQTRILLEELSHAQKLDKSKCIRKLIEEAYAKEPRIQKIQIKSEYIKNKIEV